MKCTAIILGAGSATRMNGINKQLLTLKGIPVIIRSALNFENCPEVSEIIIVTKKEDISVIESLSRTYGITKLKKVCEGGKNRAESAEKGFTFAGETDVVAVHDGARPFASSELISRVIKDAYENGGAISAVPVKDTIKIVKDGFIGATPDRSTLYSAQTPQAFRYEIYCEMVKSVGEVTDDAQLAERLGVKVKITEGLYKNIKITTPDDILQGEMILTEDEKNA